MITGVALGVGSVGGWARPWLGAGVAVASGAGLSERALGVTVDGEMRDLARTIGHDANIEIITAKSPEALELLRHDAAHVMAEAVQELYPDTQVTIGPAIENGFYYDFARDEPFKPEDLEKIEAKMREIVQRDETSTRAGWELSRIHS